MVVSYDFYLFYFFYFSSNKVRKASGFNETIELNELSIEQQSFVNWNASNAMIKLIINRQRKAKEIEMRLPTDIQFSIVEF